MSLKTSKFVSAVLLDDSDDESSVLYQQPSPTPTITPPPPPSITPSPSITSLPQLIQHHKTIKRKLPEPLKHFFKPDNAVLEIGVDEAGRGPLFGRVYAGAVILPKDSSFNHSLMKDSKKFTSASKIEEVEKYIKDHAIAWGIGYETESTIDDINILQATQSAMHKAIASAIKQTNCNDYINADTFYLLVDGNYFKPYTFYNSRDNSVSSVQYSTVEKGDNTYTSIAAASILAKVARDRYVHDLCAENPELDERYSIKSNKGYGAKKHLEGIAQHGITKWHRRSFGICKQY